MNSRMRLVRLMLAIVLGAVSAGAGVAAGPEAPQAEFTVSNTSDSGLHSLRQAILDANRSTGIFDTIAFAIPISDPNYNSSAGVFAIPVLLSCRKSDCSVPLSFGNPRRRD